MFRRAKALVGLDIGSSAVKAVELKSAGKGYKVTGRKEEQKLYRYHSGYEGGVRSERLKEVRAKQPARIVEEAVRGMLPKTKMGEAMWRKLKVYAGDKHPHAAQKPKASGDTSPAAKKITSRSEVA